ncbi:MAG: secretin N-terminal domain-containing protein, partial [Pirellulales bacterium]
MHAHLRIRVSVFAGLLLLTSVSAFAQQAVADSDPAAATQPPAAEQPAAAAPASEQPAADKPAGVEPKLRFNFRFQRWSDVLEWFAEQAGLSLVLDAPPPGTFNYTDNRDYSVAESLDLLNGVLLTKGFTLVRRERMLILVDLSQGVPETLVPRVTLEELDKRGRFEIVSVLFPVGKRAATDVVTEIAPLLSPRGKSQPLTQTGQVLVTDTAGVMRAINAVIESMPQPAVAAPGVAEKPQLAVYPLKNADPDAAVQVLEALMPDAKFVRDPAANQLSAYATPTQQAAVKSVVEQLQSAEGPPESRARFEVYLLDNVDPAG